MSQYDLLSSEYLNRRVPEYEEGMQKILQRRSLKKRRPCFDKLELCNVYRTVLYLTWNVL